MTCIIKEHVHVFNFVNKKWIKSITRSVSMPFVTGQIKWQTPNGENGRLSPKNELLDQESLTQEWSLIQNNGSLWEHSRIKN